MDKYLATMIQTLHKISVTVDGQFNARTSNYSGFVAKHRTCDNLGRGLSLIEAICITILGKLFTPMCLCYQAV